MFSNLSQRKKTALTIVSVVVLIAAIALGVALTNAEARANLELAVCRREV
jgi:hypothetical protein